MENQNQEYKKEFHCQGFQLKFIDPPNWDFRFKMSNIIKELNRFIRNYTFNEQLELNNYSGQFTKYIVNIPKETAEILSTVKEVKSEDVYYIKTNVLNKLGVSKSELIKAGELKGLFEDSKKEAEDVFFANPDNIKNLFITCFGKDDASKINYNPSGTEAIIELEDVIEEVKKSFFFIWNLFPKH